MSKVAAILFSIAALAGCKLNYWNVDPTTKGPTDWAIVVFSVGEHGTDTEWVADNGPYMWWCRIVDELSDLTHVGFMSRIDVADQGIGYRAFEIKPGTYVFSYFGIGWGGIHATFRDDQTHSFAVKAGEVVYLGHFEWEVLPKSELKDPERPPFLTTSSGEKFWEAPALYSLEDRYQEAVDWVAANYPGLSGKVQKRLVTQGFHPRAGFHTYEDAREEGWGKFVCR
ncbi:MAG: hypothetical protein R8L07_01540 [Alphaproteobacteria bacterium]|nr:hypothetical protein [Alphaproteobacteria bacterium]